MKTTWSLSVYVHVYKFSMLAMDFCAHVTPRSFINIKLLEKKLDEYKTKN